jgi:serine/threonine protein kinase
MCEPVQPAILLCLLDIARGLEYLHSCSIVHGDLKPQNVMLKTAAADRRGFVCKLGDFGLSRMLQETETHVNTGSYGTVTHAAPELLSEGRLTKSSDVFAFGMLLWELVTGDRLFRDMHHMQVGAVSECAPCAQCCGCSAAHPLQALLLHVACLSSHLPIHIALHPRRSLCK